MKRLLIASILGAFLLPGCIVVAETHTVRRDPPPPPPPPPPPTVTVAWMDARTVLLREYYDCDWDTVGAFEYYENDCGYPEDDLFFLLHVSRVTGRNFHEVVFTYSTHNRVLFEVCRSYRVNTWGLYIDLPHGYVCPPAYSRAYGYYWRRDNRVVLTNYECHALFWLRFSVHYYGWQPNECFTRWDRCVDTRVRYVTVVHRDYGRAGHGGRNWAERPVVKCNERPERDRRTVEVKREENRRRVEVEVQKRGHEGQKVVKPIPRQEIERHREDQRRREDEERRREIEERKKAPRKYDDNKPVDKGNQKGPPPKEDPKKNEPKQPPPKDDRRDDRKDDRDQRKDDRRDPPPKEEKKKEDPKKEEPKKEEKKKEDPKKDDSSKDGNRKDDREDRRDDRQGDRDQRKDDRKDPPPKEEKKEEKKKEEPKKEEKKKEEPKKEEKKDDGKSPKKDDSKQGKNDGRRNR